MGNDLDSLPLELAKHDVTEGAGIPFPFDRDAVRTKQVVNNRAFLVGTLELELDLEAMAVGERRNILVKTTPFWPWSGTPLPGP